MLLGSGVQNHCNRVCFWIAVSRNHIQNQCFLIVGFKNHAKNNCFWMLIPEVMVENGVSGIAHAAELAGTVMEHW